jgi:hypothetical protein
MRSIEKKITQRRRVKGDAQRKRARCIVPLRGKRRG